MTRLEARVMAHPSIVRANQHPSSGGDAEPGTWRYRAAKIWDGGSQGTIGDDSKGISPYPADRDVSGGNSLNPNRHNEYELPKTKKDDAFTIYVTLDSSTVPGTK